MLNAILKRLSEEEAVASLLRHVFTDGDGFGKSQLSIILKDLLERVWLNFRDFANHVVSSSEGGREDGPSEGTLGGGGGGGGGKATRKDPAAQSAAPTGSWASPLHAALPLVRGNSADYLSEQQFLQSLPGFRRNDAVYNDLVQALQNQLLSIWSESHPAGEGKLAGARTATSSRGRKGTGWRPSLHLRSVRALIALVGLSDCPRACVVCVCVCAQNRTRSYSHHC